MFLLQPDLIISTGTSVNFLAVFLWGGERGRVLRVCWDPGFWAQSMGCEGWGELAGVYEGFNCQA